MKCRCAALIVLLCAAGCLWRGYATIMAVHLDVLTQTAAKLCAVVQAGKGPAAEEMGEYIYPLKRAREFMGQFSSYAERRSYQQFGMLLDRYDAMVRAVDAARAAGGLTPEGSTRLAAERDALQQLAAQIRADLQAGR